MIDGEKEEKRERETGRKRERENKIMWWNSYTSIKKNAAIQGGPAGGNT
jgi:hypothetical protein